MKTYIYVIAEKIDGEVSFRHAFVQAEDMDDAYWQGKLTVRQPTDEGLNDYVIELPAKENTMSVLFDLTPDEMAQVKEFQSWFPYRIIYVARNVKTGESIVSGVLNRAIPNALVRQGWNVVIVSKAKD